MLEASDADLHKSPPPIPKTASESFLIQCSRKQSTWDKSYLHPDRRQPPRFNGEEAETEFLMLYSTEVLKVALWSLDSLPSALSSNYLWILKSSFAIILFGNLRGSLTLRIQVLCEIASTAKQRKWRPIIAHNSWTDLKSEGTTVGEMWLWHNSLFVLISWVLPPSSFL